MESITGGQVGKCIVMRKESWSAFCQKVDDEEPGGFLGNYGRDVSYIAVVEAKPAQAAAASKSLGGERKLA